MARKAWWEEELEQVGMDLKSDESFSGKWRSQLGIMAVDQHDLFEEADREFREDGDDDEEHGQQAGDGVSVYRRLRSVSRKLARTVNVVRNTDELGNEKNLFIEWSDGNKVNSPTTNTIYLSPDDVLKFEGENEDVMMDVLTGQILLAQTMKRTTSREAYKAAQESEDTTVKNLWMAVETAIARNEVLESWAGFGPYFARHARYHGANKNNVQGAVMYADRSPEMAVLALSWNLMYPTDRIKLPEYYEDPLSRAMQVLRDNQQKTKRYFAASEAVRIIREHFATVEPPPPPPIPQKPPPKPEPQPEPKQEESEQPPEQQESSPNKEQEPGDGEGEYESDPEENADAEPKEEGEGESEESEGQDDGIEFEYSPGDEPPQLVDNELFGDRVQNDSVHDREDIPEAIDLKEVEAEQIEVPEGCCEMRSQPVVHHVELEDPEPYMKLVRQMRPQIMHIREALRFRSNEPGAYQRGLKSGLLDDGSIYKLALPRENNPAIWEQKVEFTMPKIAVGLLLDESGSMGGRKIEETRRVAVAMHNALSSVKGIDTMVLGHTGNIEHVGYESMQRYKGYGRRGYGRGSVSDASPYDVVKDITPKTTKHANQLLMREYWTVRHKQPYGIVHAGDFMCQNLDGFAMEYAARKMQHDYPEHKTRLLFVISDGQPSGYGGLDCRSAGRLGYYHGSSAMLHMRRVCEFSRHYLGVQIYGIGIQNAYTESAATHMYGAGKAVVISDVISSLHILTAFLKQIASKV